MWNKTETEYVINIEPKGEEGMHIVDEECACGPRVNGSDDKRTMIVHRTFHGAVGFDLVGDPVPEFYRERMAA